ncbi:MAG: YceD family protein [Armatimonadota bacterium]
MKLDLSEFARVPGSYAEHEIDMTFKEVEGMTLTAPVRGKMTVSSTGRVLLLEGAVDTEVEQVCFRCGGTYRQPVHAEFQEEFVMRPSQAAGQGPRVEEEEEAPETRLFYEGTLDLNLDELLRQSILVALPMKPLCADDCQGLCPRCGHRLNEGPCGCAPEETGSPLGALRQVWEQKHKA